MGCENGYSVRLPRAVNVVRGALMGFRYCGTDVVALAVSSMADF